MTLIFSLRHLEENLDDWLTEELENFLDDDYLVFDCPGNALMLSHFSCMNSDKFCIQLFRYIRVHIMFFAGQIELFSHVPVLKNFVEHLQRKNFNVCAVYLLDSQVCVLFWLLLLLPSMSNWFLHFQFFGISRFILNLETFTFICQFITDVTKFISGCMASLSAMVQLELPHVNILSKMDLVRNKRDIEE